MAKKLNEVEQFEKDHGSVELIKAAVSVLCRVLVKKGISTKKKLRTRLEKEIRKRMEK
jgi:hypothetical protein